MTDNNFFTISVKNKISGATGTMDVVDENTLGQLLDICGSEIGINGDNNIIFTNEETGKSTSDRNTTVGELGLKKGSILQFSDDGKVAAC